MRTILKSVFNVLSLTVFLSVYKCECVEYRRNEPGYYEARLRFQLEESVTRWLALFQFESPLKNLSIITSNTDIFSVSRDNTTFTFGSVGAFPIGVGEWNIDFSAGYEITGPLPQLLVANFNGKDIPAGYIPPPSITPRPTRPPPPEGGYHYDELIAMSLEFYEAQRSGKLPGNNRIPWRGDSFLDDGRANGLDLSGGYFDAADLVKFGFPLTTTLTVLNWGIIDFLEGYQAAGELDNAYGALRWGLDWLLKAHPSKFELYGQVADAHKDHAWWGRPEEWDQGLRESFKITRENPGTEIAAEGAASFASGFLVFKDLDRNYAEELLQHAKDLYEFADLYRGNYTDAIPAAVGFYDSWSGYGDELGWAAAWLYRATGDQKYLRDAERHWIDFNLGRRAEKFSWDDKKVGLQILLAKLTFGNMTYLRPAFQFCDYMKNEARKTPKGLLFIQEWGSLRHAANVAFICLNLAELEHSTDPSREHWRRFAKEQIHYALGDSGRSFVVGFGDNPPLRPRHRASSCPYHPSPCHRQNGLYNPGPNYYTLYGALVGGPGSQDEYEDDRDDYVHNEVAIDYNAGFQGALAALHKLKVNGEI